MAIAVAQLSAMIGEIYAAAGSPERFSQALRRIRTLLNASSGMLFTPLADPGNGGFGFVDHFNTEFFAKYRAYYWDKDPWAREGVRKGLMRTHNTVTDQALISQHDLQKEEIYPDLLVPMDTARICCHVVTVDEDSTIPRTYLSLYRGAGSRPFSEEERRLLNLLGPHVGQALRLSYRLDFAEMSRQSAYDALHEVRCGVVLLDVDKRIVFMNKRAEPLCAGKRGLLAGGPLVEGMTLHAIRSREDARLQRAIDAALRALVPLQEHQTAVGKVAIHAPDGSTASVATVIPLPMSMRAPTGPQARVVVFVDDLSSKRSTDDELLGTLYGLSPAECRVARALLTGDQPKLIADRFGVSENTIRTQIKAVYAKTGTRRMAVLIKLLSQLADTEGAPAAAGGPRVPWKRP